ncbi:PIN domain-containing protein [Massilia sp. Root1485]|uniref:PIN domain-containing protein n=1 Tax=Massilia sp. Root1485 TaxID=1736472 RepID=UPI0006F29C9E|nr:PIN domain-containing protein [Massilia sp. Root1485]KQZ34965.1 hypothetical protein ASD92_07660 [Massilia sp. Root1485]
MTGSVRLDLGVPLQRFIVTVQHSTPRVPNPLESALIHMVLRLGALPHYRERTLAQLFSEMLCIPQPELWLVPMLEELVDIRLLTCSRNLDDAGAIALGDLALTERGQQMISNGKLLGRPQRINVTWCWDPVALEVRHPQQWERLVRQAPTLALPADVYDDVFPMEAFRADLASASWYRAGETVIESVTPFGRPEVAWETVAVDAALDGTRLVCSAARPAVRHYLQEQDDELLTTRLAAAVFGEGYAEFDDWEKLVPAGGDPILTLAQLAQRLGPAREVAYDDTVLEVLDGLEQGPEGGLRVHYSGTGEAPEVEFDPKHGHSIVSGGTMPAADCHVVDDGQGWRLGRAAVQIGRSALPVPVALQVRRKQAVADAALARELLKTRAPLMIAAALRLDPETAWPTLLRELRSAHQGKACLDVVLAWMTEMLRLVPRAAAVVDRHVLQDVFADALRAHGRIGTAGELTTWRIAMQALEPPAPQPLLEQLLQATYPATSIAALGGMTDEARKVVKDYCIPYGPASYASPLVAELLALGSIEQVEAALRNPNPFERQLRALWKDGTALARILGTTFPVRPPAPNALAKILRERKSEACIGAIRQWRDTLDGFCRFAQIETPDPNSAFETSRISLKEWEEQLVRAAASNAGHFDYVFVVDTNALINMPELPLKMTGNVLLVLPQVVLDELDKKKRDPALVKACAQTVRLLRDMPDSRRRYEESDLSLLPSDFEDTADNRILSVAMKYHHPNLRLITDDAILMRKAESMKIPPVTIERFGGKAVRQAGAKNQQKKQHKNQHKGEPVL